MHGSVQDLEAALPDARGYLISGADHAFIFEKPGQFTGILRAWFSDQPLPEEIFLQ